MFRRLVRTDTFVELILILTCLGITALLAIVRENQGVILNLYFLPVTLAGFAMGCYRGGVLALLCALLASVVVAFDVAKFSAVLSTSAPILALALWAASLGLASLMIGTLSDDRKNKMEELHEAYVGVAEVLAQYLQGANPQLKSRSIRAADLGRKVAVRMQFSPTEVDDVCVATLLYDLGNIEITTRVMRRAIDTLGGEMRAFQPNTFQGIDLMLSLGSVLRGAVPLLLSQNRAISPPAPAGRASCTLPLGAEIIRTVRAYCEIIAGDQDGLTPAEAIQRLCSNSAPGHDPKVLEALEAVVTAGSRHATQVRFAESMTILEPVAPN